MELRTHRKWEGTWQMLDGQEYYFFNGADLYGPAGKNRPGFWSGAEGYAHPIKDRAANKYVLKSFQFYCSERAQRMEWLCEQRLCDFDGLKGAPYQFVPSVKAQICPFVEGKTWSELKAARTKLTAEQRLRLAFRLAGTAVRLLEEGVALSHSDLSPGNILIRLESEPDLNLIDFDAFYHPKLPVLPADKGRTIGTAGYQAHEFLVPGQVIQTDRFALAVLIHELLAFGVDQDSGDPDYRFFEQADLNRRSVAPTQRFKGCWGDCVFDLVQRALTARRTADRPAPLEWCDAFLALGAPPAQLGLLMTAERNGKRQRFDLKSPHIDLAAALADQTVDLHLQCTPRGYQVARRGGSTAVGKPAILKEPHSGKHVSLDSQPRDVVPGSVICIAGWELTFHAKQQQT